MDPFLVLLHSVSAGLSSSELTELKFLCQGRVGKRKLERVQSGLDLFSVLLEQNELDPEHTVLLRELLASLRRHDLLRRLDDYEAGAAGGASPEEQDLRAAFDIICDNVGKDWKRLARRLKVSDAKIDAIEEKYPRNLTEQLRESLRVWRNANREDAAVAHLVGALRACRMNLVADLIEEDQQARGLRDQDENAGSTVSMMSWGSDAPTSGAQ
ncbi:FAS-associated death domain protein [Equus asinus]|uniref:FAS-associated death domain protein n=2 Tax=Equus asinus TaxID=9793 RepID=A0A9L0JB10_EQUAS|nr:FAS-associated death domain protein [Equus asinus]XP_046499978.1 FAS-associated death domain protein [Equus quagga]